MGNSISVSSEFYVPPEKFLNNNGLEHLWDKIKSLVSLKADKTTALEYRGIVYDANDATANGIYHFNGSTPNAPTTSPFECMVMNFGERYIQIATRDTSTTDKYLYKRTCYDNVWGSWYRYADDKTTDYIVEEGTSGNWSYIKWNSGRIELINKNYSFSSLSWSSWGTLSGFHYSKPSVSIPNNLLNSDDYVVNVCCNQGNYFMIGAVYNKTKTSFTPVLVRPNSTSSSSATIQIIGAWK